MSRFTFLFVFTAIFVSQTAAQWQPVTIPGVTTPVSTVFSFYEIDELIAGTRGDGVFYSMDQGETWTDITLNLGNKNVNYVLGSVETVFMVCSIDGLYVYLKESNQHVSLSSGIENRDITFVFPDIFDSFFAVGTNGGGVYITDDFGTPWQKYNDGLEGDALIANASDVLSSEGAGEYYLLGTENGLYATGTELNGWTSVSSGLTGNSLKINDVFPHGSPILVATDDGIYSADVTGLQNIGDLQWEPMLKGVKINSFVFEPVSEKVFAFGEGGFLGDENTFSWIPVDTGGIPADGEIISATATIEGNIFAVVKTSGSDPSDKGTIYSNSAALIVSSATKPLKNETELFEIFPNPVKGVTQFGFNLNAAAEVVITITGVNGETADIISAGKYMSGNHLLNYNSDKLPAGIYFCSLTVNGKSTARTKMVVMH